MVLVGQFILIKHDHSMSDTNEAIASVEGGEGDFSING